MDMFSDYSRELLKSGIIEAKAGNRESARRYLDRAVYMSRDHSVLAEAWFWMSQMSDEAAEKRKALENCLVHDLQHARARRALAILDGKLKADEIVDPDHLPPPPEGLRAADAQRFMCPKCGARMSFSADGQSLVCEYCSRNQRFTAQPGSADEKDFLIAMATARGHGKPLNQQVFHCEGCGSEFILPANQISTTCVYCGSPHVVNWESEEQLLEPDGIIPHTFDQQQAIKYLTAWVDGNRIKPERQVDLPRGLYLPLWTFDIGGAVDYTAEVYENDHQLFDEYSRERKVQRISDSYPVLLDDMKILASRRMSAPFLRLISTFDLKAVRPYDPRYLADWPAEVYDVPLAEASLDARSFAYSHFKDNLPHQLGNMHLIHTSSARLAVQSFKLVLLPVWMIEIPYAGRENLILINGQNGRVEGEMPNVSVSGDQSRKPGGLMEWLGDLLGE
jgi:DNA-directed RNA polymerase subunit RPC12/RpoP